MCSKWMKFGCILLRYTSYVEPWRLEVWSWLETCYKSEGYFCFVLFLFVCFVCLFVFVFCKLSFYSILHLFLFLCSNPPILKIVFVCLFISLFCILLPLHIDLFKLILSVKIQSVMRSFLHPCSFHVYSNPPHLKKKRKLFVCLFISLFAFYSYIYRSFQIDPFPLKSKHAWSCNIPIARFHA